MPYDPEVQDAIARYFHYLGELIGTFNFTRRGRERALGLDAAYLVAEGIVDRSATKQGGATGIWPANTAEYDADKMAKYAVQLIGFRTGQMISIPSLLGNVDIEPLTVTMRYGTNTPPARSMTGYISVQDQRVTDSQKAEWFTDKKGEFYEPDEQIADKVREHFAGELDRFIDELNAIS